VVTEPARIAGWNSPTGEHHHDKDVLMRIFVGNLPFATTEEELSQLFESYGIVAGAHIVRNHRTGHSRGFGFVEMPNATEARAAIAALNGTLLEGRTLHVSEAHQQEGDERPQRPPQERGPRW
jgi:RNA recognition motif-containing protein